MSSTCFNDRRKSGACGAWRFALATAALAAAVLIAPFAARAEAPAQCSLPTHTAQVGSGTLVWNTVGVGPTVLLIHGLFADKEQWSDLACRLADAGFAAIAPDLPGYGRSEGYAVTDYQLETQASL